MKVTKKLVAALALVAAIPVAQAGTYVGVGYAGYEVEDTGSSADIDTATFKLGYTFDKVGDVEFSIEGRYGFGISEDETDFMGYDLEIDLDKVFGAYGVAAYPVIVNLPHPVTVSPYVLVGYSSAKATAKLDLGPTEVSASDSYSDLSYGAGVSIDLLDHLSAGVEYSKMLDDDISIDGFSVGLTYKF